MSKYSEVKKYLKRNKYVLCSFYRLIFHSLFVSKDNSGTVVNGGTAYSRALILQKFFLNCFNEKPFIIGEKCFLFHFKSFFRSQDI